MKVFLRFSASLAMLSTLAISNSHAGSISAFIPQAPSIESPAQENTDISRLPRLEGSILSAKDGSENVTNITLTSAEWIVFEASTASTTTPEVRLLGGAQQSNPADNQVANGTAEFAFPLTGVTFGGLTATKIKVEQIGKVTLFDDANTIIAVADVKPDDYDKFTSSNDNAFVAIQVRPTDIQIQWYYKDAIGFTDWMNTAQVTILSDSRIFLSFENNNFSHQFFNISRGNIGCAMKLTNNPNLVNDYRTVAKWKVDLEAAPINASKFSVVCTPNETQDGLKVQDFPEGDTITPFTLPQLHSFSANEINYTLANNEKLKPDTKYTAILRYKVKLTSDISPTPTIHASGWSAQTNFTTTSVVDSAYELELPSDLNFKLNQPRELSFTLKNTGTEVGSPQFIINFPFNVLDNIDGQVNKLSDFYSISSSDADCKLENEGENESIKTKIICKTTNLNPNGSIIINTRITLKDEAIKTIPYKVCDAVNCSSTSSKELKIIYPDNTNPSNPGDGNSNTPDDGNPDNPGETKDKEGDKQSSSSDSSSVGFVFWLLAAFPLLRRRRV